jgi:transcriptional regulator with XRE-family HTH domain
MPRTATSAIEAKIVGAKLREVRIAEGLTQAAVAERLQVTAAYVQKLEAGRANPTVGQLANVAAALGRSLNVQFAVIAEAPDPFAEFAAR